MKEEVIKWTDEMGIQMSTAKISKQVKELVDESKVDKTQGHESSKMQS